LNRLKKRKSEMADEKLTEKLSKENGDPPRMMEDICPGCYIPCFACFGLDQIRKRPKKD
jgi:hypothetical protein